MALASTGASILGSTVTITSSGNVGIGVVSPTYELQLSADSAAKPTTNTWTIPSDRRLKKNIVPFTDGLQTIAKISPVRYQLNGMAGLPENAEGIGIVAEDVQNAIPYTIKPFEAKMNPKDKNAKPEKLLGFNSGPLTFVLINAIKEQQKEIEDLRAQVLALQKTRQ